MREEVRNLINVGKERGYLLSDEVDNVLPAGVTSSEEIDDLLSTFERIGISIYEDLAAAKAARSAPDPVVSETPTVEWSDRSPVPEESELDLAPGMLDKNNDPVRLYLREMGLVP
jgi:RNA polymerase primary sigma factor